MCCTFTGLAGTLLLVLLQEIDLLRPLVSKYSQNFFVALKEKPHTVTCWLICVRGGWIFNIFRILHISWISALSPQNFLMEGASASYYLN